MKTLISFGFTTTLFFIFLILKLTNHIDWSWFWVVSPLILGAALWVVLLITVIAVLGYLSE